MYAVVASGAVSQWFPTLPHSYMGYSGLKNMTPPELAVIGILPVVDKTASADSQFYQPTGQRSVVIFPTLVEVTRTLQPIALQAAKNLRIQQIAQAVDQTLKSGFLIAGRTWSADPEVRNLLVAVLSLINSGAVLPGGFTFRDINDQAVAMNAAQVTGLVQQMTTAHWQVYNTAAKKRDDVRSATTVEEVLTVLP